ncbi:MAG: orotidine-5'-phosphate decarboxylase, partial [Kiritimatiellia bacterium]
MHSTPCPPPLIVALDVPGAEDVRRILRQLPSAVEYYKVGLELFIADGPAALDLLRKSRKKVFLDLKLHDIPNTVQRAVRAAARHEAALLTLHAAGGRVMLTAAAAAAREFGAAAPLLLAVTTLTSLTDADLLEAGIQRTVPEQATGLGELAIKSGITGMVAAVAETPQLRQRFGHEICIVTPGIRPVGGNRADQRRVATPAMAVQAGTSFIVMGRPILEATDPGSAAAA